MPKLCLKAQVNLVIEGRNHPMGAPHPRYGGGKRLADRLELGSAEEEPAGFYLTVWVGGNSRAYDIAKLDAQGGAQLSMEVSDGDPDTVKFAVSYACYGDKGGRSYNLASNFVPVEDLCQLVKGCKGCLSMSNNFQRNTAVLRISDAGTDFRGLGALALTRSCMRDSERLNSTLMQMGQGVRKMISKSSVLPFNAGTMFIDNLTYLPMENMPSSYCTLGYSFSQMRSGVTDSWLVYDAYKTLEVLPLRLAGLASLSDERLVDYFGVHMLTRHTSCELTAPYSSDVTLDAQGNSTSPTEDIGRSMCCTQLHVQGATQRYTPLDSSKLDIAACLTGLASALERQSEPAASRRMSASALHDDCENSSQEIQAKAKALTQLCDDWEDKGAAALAKHMESMSDASAPNRHLFAKLAAKDHALMAPVLLRLGALLRSGDWALGFAVVSAKGASYTPSSDGSELNGHGTIISRHKCSNGEFAHQPLEGTSYITCDRTRDPSLPLKLTVQLNDNTMHAFDLAELGTILSQNMYTVAGLSRFSRVLGHINNQYENPLADCPFYVAAFYSSLPMGKDTRTIGCVPFELSSRGQTGHIFGAPVIGLSSRTTVAAPIVSEQEDLIQFLREQANEAWPPEASPRQVENLMSFWQPCDTVDYSSQTLDMSRCIRGECNSSFDNPQHASMAAVLYKVIATRFNVLQASPPACLAALF